MTSSDKQSKNGDTGTFLSHTHIDDAGGRFAAVNAAKVVGQTPAIAAAYPAASAAHQTALPPEEPLGYSIDAMPGLETSTSPCVEANDDPANAPSSGSGPACPSDDLVSERAGSSPFSESETEKDDGLTRASGRTCQAAHRSRSNGVRAAALPTPSMRTSNRQSRSQRQGRYAAMSGRRIGAVSI